MRSRGSHYRPLCRRRKEERASLRLDVLVDAGQVLAEALALDEATAVAVALDVDRVVVGVHAGGAVTDGIQARDGLAVGVESLEVLVDLDATAHAEQAGADLNRVEGRLGDGEEEVGLLVEVGVLAGGAQLVVVGDGLEGDIGRHVELGHELFDGVGRLVVVGGVLDTAHDALGVGGGGVGGGGAHSAEAVPEHAAAELEGRGVVGLEVGVKDGPGVVVAAVHHDAHALALD